MRVSYAVVTVTYNPALDVLARQFSALKDAPLVVVVDNASEPAMLSGVRALTSSLVRSQVVAHERNVGLAAALNAGARAALEAMPDCEYLLFLDQDTEPGVAGCAALVAAANTLRSRDVRAAVFGPLVVDAATGLDHGIHVIRGLRWTRVHPAAGHTEPVPCASINGSGMLVHVSAFRALQGFEEELFIDHVDSEFSFRAARAGHGLYTLPAVRFIHRMGEHSMRFWLGGWRVWPYRNPQRHYYLYRNAVALMRRAYVPGIWKGWAVVKLGLTAAVHLVTDGSRIEQLRAMTRGVRDGTRMRAAEPPR